MQDNERREEMMSDADAMSAAQSKVAQALAELERATEGYVRGVHVVDVETTTYSDTRKQMQRRVEIDLEPKPGTNWSG